MKKTIKSLSALFLVFMLSFGIFMSVNVKADSNITVKIQMTGMRGANSSTTQVIAEDTIPYTPGMTAFDAIKAIAIQPTDTQTTDVVNNVTYYNKGLLRWCSTGWGDYISAIKVSGHSSSNRYFNTNGTAISTARGDYFKLASLNATAALLHYPTNATWSNVVNKTDYVSEGDYNYFSGWMVLINGNTNNNGIGTTLTSSTESVVLDFSMMMGLDLGQDSYMQDYVSEEWVPVSAWN